MHAASETFDTLRPLLFSIAYRMLGSVGDAEDIAMVATVREALGPGPRLRLDANGSWTISQALRN